MNSFKDMCQVLDSLKFGDFYRENVRNANYRVNYGNRKGEFAFTSILSAAEQYTIETSDIYTVNIDRQLTPLELTTDVDLILQCIEVFDWGGVQSSNIITAINMHRNGNLRGSLIEWKHWFENDDELSVNLSNVLWSSGWTKVFSFLFDLTTIYDSRVAAYINYIFAVFFQSLHDSEKKAELQSITQHLLSFQGTTLRARRLNQEFRAYLGVKMKSSNDERSFVANKVASWFLRYVCQLEFGVVTQANFRQIDKAMFMLGFDINQIDANAPFE